MKKRSSIALLTALLAIVFAAGISVYSNYIGMQIYQESSNHLLESYAQISKTFTLFVQRNWVVLSQWDSLMKNAQEDADIDSIWPDAQNNKLLWHYSDFYLFNESTQYLTVDGRKGSADSINGVFQEMYSKGEPIVSTYTATYGVPKIAFAMPMSRSLTLDGVTYTGIAVSYDTDVVDDLVDGSMYGGQSDCYVVRSNGDIVLELEPQTELCEGMTNLYDLSDHVDWKYGSMDDIRDCIQLGKSGSAQFTCDGVLLRSGRGHMSEDTVKAAKLVKDAGFTLILQMMTGLPGSDDARDIQTARSIAALHPDGVRIYPTVILRDTPLCDLWQAGKYREHTVEDAVRVCARILPIFENAGIPVIRLGLNPSDELSGGAAVGGAYHPALGELVRSRLWRDKAEAILSGVEPGADVVLGVSANRISVMTGQHRANLSYLQERFALRSVCVCASDVPDGEIVRI